MWCVTICRYATDYMVAYALIEHRKLIQLVKVYSKLARGYITCTHH